MRRDAEWAWDVAEAASWKAGNPYNDRQGNTVYPKPKRIGMLQRVLEEVQRRIDSHDMQWPAP